ncbi:DUF2922 domain-containing protein [Priestia flexa]|uniref:DUF2922 domain-containing protein n=1 Tax=Priestia flexa TaxID=86664 RepID=UPI0032EFF405
MKTLTMQFLNLEQKTVGISIEQPKEGLEATDIGAVIDQILASNVFTSNGGMLTSKKGAQIIERNITEFEI